MAKKKEEVAVETNHSERLLAEITKQYGEGIMVNATRILDEPPMVIPMSPNLDSALSGGVPEGSWLSISGPPKVGKTTTLLSFAAECQKPENGGRRVYYGNVERRLKRMNLAGTRGLDTSPDKFVVIQSDESKILSAQDHLDIYTKILQSDRGCLLIIDSISALVDSRILDGGIGTETRGSGPKLVSQFIDIVASVVPVYKSIVCGVTHLIADTSGRTQGKVEKAANRWIYQADIRLKATYAEAWKVGASADGEGGTQIGQVVKWLCQCSALGPPGMKADGYLRYGVGVDKVYEAFENAAAAGLIDKAGSWYTLSFMQRHLDLLGVTAWNDEVMKRCRAQGGENIYKLLQDNPLWVKALEDEVTAFLGGPES